MFKDRKLTCETESLHLVMGSRFFMFKRGKKHHHYDGSLIAWRLTFLGMGTLQVKD